jgi:hypothetical protein
MSELEKRLQIEALEKAADQLRLSARLLVSGKAPMLALRARHDAQEADTRARQLRVGLIP